MHPIERLRYVARASGAEPSLLVREAAGALAAFADDPPGLVTACRRLVDRHATSGPLWWLAAKVLAAGDPMAEAWRAAEELEDDPTATVLARALPDDSTVLVIGWPEQCTDAIRRRGDVELLVVDALGDGMAFTGRLRSAGADAVDVPESGVGAAAAEADVVLLEASALGPTGLVAIAGSHAAAAVARAAGKQVWAVAGVGRVLPGRLWDALVARLEDSGDPWDLDEEVVPLSLVDRVVGPQGALDATEAPKRADCPVAPELLKALG